jgi:hypothetical protein
MLREGAPIDRAPENIQVSFVETFLLFLALRPTMLL